MSDCGTVYWITGLAGAGKTTIGRLLYDYLNAKKDNVIRFDGDILRNALQLASYTVKDREEYAFKICRLCKVIADQGVDIVICVIAMSDAVRKWNRENFANYKEIFLDVNIEELIRRDQHGLYSGALRNEIPNVLGVNAPAALPKAPDLVIENCGDITPDIALRMIIEAFGV